ncbi:titin homolog [Diabrotica virgifera virgifera]|uniref:Glutamic acid-rich protein-like n=1 Tax=Diabrotica virgifera virgifera TaxID=50390 RepID=A0ABM5KXH3_DIAVI|nr:titin homolog [Diabrotica virgifera virgifera]
MPKGDGEPEGKTALAGQGRTAPLDRSTRPNSWEGRWDKKRKTKKAEERAAGAKKKTEEAEKKKGTRIKGRKDGEEKWKKRKTPDLEPAQTEAREKKEKSQRKENAREEGESSSSDSSSDDESEEEEQTPNCNARTKLERLQDSVAALEKLIVEVPNTRVAIKQEVDNLRNRLFDYTEELEERKKKEEVPRKSVCTTSRGVQTNMQPLKVKKMATMGVQVDLENPEAIKRRVDAITEKMAICEYEEITEFLNEDWPEEVFQRTEVKEGDISDIAADVAVFVTNNDQDKKASVSLLFYNLQKLSLSVAAEETRRAECGRAAVAAQQVEEREVLWCNVLLSTAVNGANPEVDVVSGQSAEKKASSKKLGYRSQPKMTRVRSRSPPRSKALSPPRYADSKESLLLQHPEESSDDHSSDQEDGKDGFTIQNRRIRKKKKKSKGKDSTQNVETTENVTEATQEVEDSQNIEATQEVEDMDEDVPGAEGGGTTKRQRVEEDAASEDELTKANAEINRLRTLMKEFAANVDANNKKYEEVIAQQKAEIKELNTEIRRMSEKMDARFDELIALQKQLAKKSEKKNPEKTDKKPPIFLIVTFSGALLENGKKG